MSSTLEYADDNVAYTQCSVGFFFGLSTVGTRFSFCARFSASIFDLQIIFAFHTNDLCFYSCVAWVFFSFLGPAW